MEPNVNKFCVVCKETDAKLRMIEGGDSLCPVCLASYPDAKVVKATRQSSSEEKLEK